MPVFNTFPAASFMMLRDYRPLLYILQVPNGAHLRQNDAPCEIVSITVCLVTLLPHHYPSDQSKVGLVGALLSGTALAWFAPLLESQSPPLSNIPAFLTKLEATFGNTDKERTSAAKLGALQQGSKPASTCAAAFCLLTSLTEI
ncbi:hypothetical protein K7432_018180 [Basidiobolus ranarum]|uniref:DUF4939 domain-containing protein n=1 Tax=Basidiobolus ranarum TaxID=34480 RepID=A0ABR2WCH3_9FUNG